MHLGQLNRQLKKVIYTFIIVIIALIILLPIIVTVTNSFMPESEIYDSYKAVNTSAILGGESGNTIDYSVFKFIPQIVVIKQYYAITIKNINYLFYFWNSVKIVFPIIIGQLIVASMAAYAFSKFSFRFREQLFFIYIVTMLMPFQVTLVPNYIIADKLGLIGQAASIIFPGIFSTFGVFLLRQFMIYIPNDYSEAAKVDGGSHFNIFFSIILPMTKTGVVSLIILLFIDNWNMVEQPLVFLKELKDYPLSIMLSSINKSEIGIAFAASTLYMTPMLLIFLYGENYLVEGVQLSGIKG
jgi:multiple sugar transport system permease protein